LTGITDERGVRIATYTYNTEGRIASTVRAPGMAGGSVGLTTYTYSATHPTATMYTTVVDGEPRAPIPLRSRTSCSG
jgi:hypothetical protein